MMTTQLAATIKERIDYMLMKGPTGMRIAVTTPSMELWDSIPWPDTLFRFGWLDPAETDGHVSGWVFPYQPEVMAASVTGLDKEGVERYVDAVMLYVGFWIQIFGDVEDRDERRRKVEDLMYDRHPERLALMSLVQTGGGR